jgi:hypothetical protein
MTSTDGQVLRKIDQDQIDADFLASVAHFVGWARSWFGTPGSASPSPGAITLSASFAGWLDGSLQLSTGHRPKLCQENKKYRTRYTEDTE